MFLTSCFNRVSIANWHPFPPTSRELLHAGLSKLSASDTVSSVVNISGSFSIGSDDCFGTGQSPPGLKNTQQMLSSIEKGCIIIIAVTLCFPMTHWQIFFSTVRYIAELLIFKTVDWLKNWKVSEITQIIYHMQRKSPGCADLRFKNYLVKLQ